MINIQFFAIGLLTAAIVAGGSYIQGRKDGRNAEIVNQKTIADTALAARDAAIQAAASEIAKITVTHTTIRQRAETITREVPIYRDCVNDPGVERLLDDARANRDPDSAGDRGMPAPGASESPHVR
jgi:hypothetical protein